MLAAERQRQQDMQMLFDSIAQQRPRGALLLTTTPMVDNRTLSVAMTRQNGRAQHLRQVLWGAL